MAYFFIVVTFILVVVFAFKIGVLKGSTPIPQLMANDGMYTVISKSVSTYKEKHLVITLRQQDGKIRCLELVSAPKSDMFKIESGHVKYIT